MFNVGCQVTNHQLTNWVTRVTQTKISKKDFTSHLAEKLSSHEDDSTLKFLAISYLVAPPCLPLCYFPPHGAPVLQLSNFPMWKKGEDVRMRRSLEELRLGCRREEWRKMEEGEGGKRRGFPFEIVEVSRTWMQRHSWTGEKRRYQKTLPSISKDP